MFSPVYKIYTQQGITDKWQQMVQCRPEHWRSLGQNYNQTFYEYGMDKMLCLNQTQQVQMLQTFQSGNVTGMNLKLLICNSLFTNKFCNRLKGYNYMIQNKVQLRIYMLDTGISPSQQQPINRFVNTDGKAIISWMVTSILTITYSQYRIITDSSLAIFSQNQQINGILSNKIQSTPKFFNPNLLSTDFATITIFMDENVKIYQRKIGKLDQLISYVGGLFEILIGFIAFFLLSFDEYRYELKVAKGAFDFYREDGSKVKQLQMDFLEYIKYSAYDWTNTLLCTRVKWKYGNEVDEVREEVNHLMEVNRLYKRILNAETATTFALGSSKMDFVKLVEPPMIDKVNQRQLKLDYHDRILMDHKLDQDQKQKLQGPKKGQNDGSTGNITQQEREKRLRAKVESIALDEKFLETERNFKNSLQALSPERRKEFEKFIASAILIRLSSEKPKTAQAV